MEENFTAYIQNQQGAVPLNCLLIITVITNEMLSFYPSKAQNTKEKR